MNKALIAFFAATLIYSSSRKIIRLKVSYINGFECKQCHTVLHNETVDFSIDLCSVFRKTKPKFKLKKFIKVLLNFKQVMAVSGQGENQQDGGDQPNEVGGPGNGQGGCRGPPPGGKLKQFKH